MFTSKPGRRDPIPQPCPQEFRGDVVRIAAGQDEDTTVAQIAKDFGIHEGTINKWVRQAEIATFLSGFNGS